MVRKAWRHNTQRKAVSGRRADRDNSLVIAGVIAQRKGKTSRGKSREPEHQQNGKDEKAALQGS
jgi:hypothetical protein